MLEHPTTTERLSDRLTRQQYVPSYDATRYRLYTEDIGDLYSLVERYFAGATFYRGVGLWEGATELSIVIEILAQSSALQNIVNLAGDIKVANNQSSVLITWESVKRLDV